MWVRAACVAAFCCGFVSAADVCETDVEESSALQVVLESVIRRRSYSMPRRRRTSYESVIRRRSLPTLPRRRRTSYSSSRHRRRSHKECSAPSPAFTLPSRGCPKTSVSSCLASNKKYDSLDSAWSSCKSTTGCSYIVRVQSGEHEGYYLRRSTDPVHDQPGAAAMEYSCVASTCPKDTPADYGACYDDGLECKYNEIQCLSGPTVFGITATCKNKYWYVDETPNACPVNPKGTCDPINPEYVSYDLGCDGDISSCLAFNEAFDTLQDAWRACGLNHKCGFITKWTDDKYYLRREDDPKQNTANAGGYIYSCEGIPKAFPAKILTCNSGSPPAKTSCADKEKMKQLNHNIRNHIHDKFETLPQECTRQSCPRGDLAGCLVRLVGHDIMDFNAATNTGGADGCLNFDETDNNGLMGCMRQAGSEVGVSLESLWQEFCTEVSIADFFVIAAETLMAATSPQANMTMWMDSFAQNFRFGRETAMTCTPPTLPDPQNSCVAVEKSFMKRMGLTAAQATALMGVHTLGRAKLENSGYDGFWLEPAQGKVFSNRYFQALIAVGWVPKETPKNKWHKTKWQWVRADVDGQNEMMLNTDMCLAYQTGKFPFTRAKDDGNKNCCLWTDRESPDMSGVDCLCRHQNVSAGCTLQNCCRSGLGECPGNKAHKTFFQDGTPEYARETAKAVTKYARRIGGLQAWHADFMPAWKKTTEQGHDLCD